MIVYFGFILLVAFAPEVLGQPIGSGVMTVGIPFVRSETGLGAAGPAY
jgi:uncharacterized membrane protein (DUF485 family)